MRSLIVAFCLLFTGIFAQTINTGLTYSVIAPKVITPKTPVLIVLHGYGSNENDLLSLASSFDKKFLVFSLRAPVSAGRGGYCWFALDFLQDKTFRYEYSAAVSSGDAIMSFVSNACKSYKADSTQVFVLGFSQGAMMSYDLAFRYSQKIKGVVALSGLLMPQTEARPTTDKLKRCRFFIAHGTQDNVITYMNGGSAAAFIKKKGVAVEFKSYSTAHSINDQEVADVNRWLISATTILKKAAK